MTAGAADAARTTDPSWGSGPFSGSGLELSDGLWRRVFAGTLSDERSAIHTIYGVRWLLLLCGAGVLEDGLQSFERRLLLMLERCLERGEPRLERRRPSAGGEALLEIGEP